MSEQAKIRILILGGGFAGLHAAMHLETLWLAIRISRSL